MENREIDRIFYRDGYRLANELLEGKLSAGNLVEAIGQLYDAVDGLLEAFLRRTAAEGRPAACRKGCSWCCHQAVFAVTHEFLYLQHYINQQIGSVDQQGILHKAREKARLTRPMPMKEQLQYRSACPLLKADACMVYQARPMACRIYLSSSELACRREHENPGDEQQFPDLFAFPLRAGRMLNEGFVAYLKQAGLQISELAIEQGYTSMVNMGQTMEGWIIQRSPSS